MDYCRREGHAANGMLAQVLNHAMIRHDSNTPDDSPDNIQRAILRRFLKVTLSANAGDRFTARQARAQQPDEDTGAPSPHSLHLIGQAVEDLHRLNQLCAEISATGRAPERQELLPHRAQQQWHKRLWGWLCICALWLTASTQRAAT